MNRIKHGNINKWSQAKAGDVIEFASSKPRHVKFEVTANSNIEVWVANDNKMSDAVLVGTSNGKTEIQYTAPATTYVQIKAEKSAAVFVNIPDIDQSVQNSDEPSFTSIEPRTSNGTDYDRMAMLMRYNQQQMEQQLEAERAVLRAERKQFSNEINEKMLKASGGDEDIAKRAASYEEAKNEAELKDAGETTE